MKLGSKNLILTVGFWSINGLSEKKSESQNFQKQIESV